MESLIAKREQRSRPSPEIGHVFELFLMMAYLPGFDLPYTLLLLLELEKTSKEFFLSKKF